MLRPAALRLPLGWLAALALAIGALAALGVPGGTAHAACDGPSPHHNVSTYRELKAALEAVEDGGGTVEMAAGVYELPLEYDPGDREWDTEGLRLASNVTLCGAGMDRTVIRWAENVPSTKLDHMLGNDRSKGFENIAIRDLTLLGRYTTQNDCCFGVRLVGVRNVEIVNVASDGHDDDGFYLGHNTKTGEGVDNTRISGCRARDNGRNGISLVQGSGNVIDNCRILENNNKVEVAGIDLEPDTGLTVSDNIIRDVIAERQNVGIQLFTFSRGGAPVTNNAVCENVVRDNKRAGIYDFQGTGNIYVGNEIEDSGTNFKVDPSARRGPASACENDLIDPDDPPGMTAQQVPSEMATLLATRRHRLELQTQRRAGKTIRYLVSRVAVEAVNGSFRRATVKVQFTLPNGRRKTAIGQTDDGVALVKLPATRAGHYTARVVKIAEVGSPSEFQPSDADAAGPFRVPRARPAGPRPAPSPTPRPAASPTPTPSR